MDHDVGESRDGLLAVRRQRLDAEPVDQSGQHSAHEGCEPDPGEPVVEGLVGDLDPVLVVERAEQVGERFDASAPQRRHHREEQAMRGDGTQALGLTGVAPELIDSVDGERSPQDVTQFGKLDGRQGWQRPSPFAGWCRNPSMRLSLSLVDPPRAPPTTARIALGIGR